jgi:membrane protein
MVGAVLPEAGRRVVTSTLRDATANVGLSVVGVGVLLWGTSKIFRAMDAAFAEIYDTERKLSLLDQFRDALVVFLALALAALATIALGSFVEVPEAVPFAWALNGLIAVLGLTVAFFPLYYVFPNIDVSFREVLPGVLVAAVGWVGLKWLFNLYVSFSSKPDVYGLIGTLVLLVTWLYVGGLVLLVGAAVNAIRAGRGGDRRAKPGGKRRFGRQMTDTDGFEERLDDLVRRAGDAGIADEEIRPILRRRAETGGATRGELTDDTEEESDPQRGRSTG